MWLLHGPANMTVYFFLVEFEFQYFLSTSTNSHLVARNGLPKIMGTLKSTSHSKITKFSKNMNMSIFTSISHKILKGHFTDVSAIINLMDVVFGIPNPISYGWPPTSSL